MTGRWRMVFRLLALLAVVSIVQARAWGQAAHVDPYQNGAAPAFPGRAMAAAAQQQAAAGTTAATAPWAYSDSILADPMTPMLMYGGMGMPLTRTQAGLAAASSIQRFTGIGSGRISGVRGGVQAAPTAAHTRNMNIVGGQASRYFNRAEPRQSTAAAPVATAAGSRNSRRYYQRPYSNFPERTRRP